MLPLVVGAIPFAIIFGAVSSTTGLSLGATMAMSAMVFAGSAQFIAVNLVAAGVSAAVIILTTFVVNLRHALYAATLAPHMKRLSQIWLLLLGFMLTDEGFVVVIARYTQPDTSPYKHWFHLGSSLFLYLNWILFTLIGILAGQQIRNPQSWGLDFALIVTFIGMLVPSVRSRPTLVAVLVAGSAAALTNGLPNKLGLSVAALLGVAAGVMADNWWREPITRLPHEEVRQ